MTRLLRVKDVEEETPVTFAFDLAAGETITSAVVTASVYKGTDPSPAAILSGPPDWSAGDSVAQMVIGGLAGVVYKLRCVATTSAGRKLVNPPLLKVKEL